MRTSVASRCVAAVAAVVAAAFALTNPVYAQVIVNNPNLPVAYPDGVYRTPAEIHTTFTGGALTIVLKNIEHRPFAGGTRLDSGPNEIETFGSTMIGLVNVNGSPFQSASGNGPVQTMVLGKVGNVTGTFQTEMLSMDLSGTSPFGPFMIRESPTLASLGQTSITDIGGGLYHIDSFFDVFTELSIDGGQTWMPADSAAHVVLGPVPEPHTLALGGLAGGLLLLRHSRRWRGQP